MAESFKDKRIQFFRKGQQGVFLKAARNNLRTTWKDIAKKYSVHDRTVRDWANEKTHIPYTVAIQLSRQTNTPLPANVKIIDRREQLRKAGLKGGESTYKKYGKVGGDETERKKAWYKWWHTKGKHLDRPILEKENIHTPRKSKELAEFVGVMLGDGGVSNYHIAITLHAIDDYPYHKFIVGLIQELFHITPKVYKHKKSNTLDIVIHRKALVEFCISLGLKQGNKLKQGLDIPSWIKQNNQYALACVRGLVDTDGSVFDHSYTVAKKKYSYKKMIFTSRSLALCKSVQKILRKNDISARITRDEEVRIENAKSMDKYMKTIKPHNRKHLKRYAK